MCGISGIVKLNRNSFNWLELSKINNIISHRGPDDEGYTFFDLNNHYTVYGESTPEYVKNSNLDYSPKNNINSIGQDIIIGLGHNRLSIIDISENGHQPMCDISSRYWLTFNGEIYNYKELKDQLQSKGYHFKTNTDSEIIIYSYIEWKEKCVDKLDGMWAFCIYDKETHCLFGSRDRFGVKPMYYYKSDNLFAFASEIKALIELDEYKKHLNNTAVFDYLVLGKSELKNESMFKDIYELPPSNYFILELKTNKFTVNNYYKLEYNKSFGKFNKLEFNHHVNEIKKLLTNSIKEHLQADVAIGTCLSGGIDSSAIVGCVDSISKIKHHKVFSACFNDSIDESKWAKLVVDRTDTDWIKCFPNPEEWLQDFEKIVYAQDLPFFSSSTYAQFKVMQSVHNAGVKVTLDGQGADELFTGYGPHFASYFHQALTSLNFKTLFSELSNLGNNFANINIIGNNYKRMTAKMFSNYFINNGFRNLHKENKYINNIFWENHKKQFRYIIDEPNNNLNRLLHHQTTGSDLKVLFRTGDRNSMYHSVESRVPFADNKKLTEYLFNIPAVYKINNGTSKNLLREAFKEFLPNDIYTRKDKIGFSTPEKTWIKQNQKQILELLPDSNDDFVEWHNIKKNWSSIVDDACNTHTVRLWRLINFAIWRKVFNI